jgi:hypothetical protein
MRRILGGLNTSAGKDNISLKSGSIRTVQGWTIEIELFVTFVCTVIFARSSLIIHSLHREDFEEEGAEDNDITQALDNPELFTEKSRLNRYQFTDPMNGLKRRGCMHSFFEQGE